MSYVKKEIGTRLIFKDMLSIHYIRNLWGDVLKFINKEVTPVDIDKYRDKQYLKLLKLKIAKDLLKFKSKLYQDNVGSLYYLHKVTKNAGLFVEYCYFYDKKGIKVPRRDLG